jgi:hypothetical protein
MDGMCRAYSQKCTQAVQVMLQVQLSSSKWLTAEKEQYPTNRADEQAKQHVCLDISHQ